MTKFFTVIGVINTTLTVLLVGLFAVVYVFAVVTVTQSGCETATNIETGEVLYSETCASEAILNG